MTAHDPHPLDRTVNDILDDYAIPPLAPGFADKVVAAAASRQGELPRLRRPAGFGVLRHGKRVMLGLVVSTALASAAAASGALEVIGIDMPPVREVVAAITGSPAAAEERVDLPQPPRAVQSAAQPEAGDPPAPDELDTAFLRADTRREQRTAIRREIVDQRIDSAIDRRRAAGLPVPDAAREAQLRERLAQRRAQQDEAAATLREQRRAAIRERVEQVEPLPLARETSAPQGDAALRPGERLRALRERVAQRREALAQDAQSTPAPPVEEN